MKKIETTIVGMRFRNLPENYLKSLPVSKTKLVMEPSNKHDPYAVKCMFGSTHFGYIQRQKSFRVTQLLKTYEKYSVTETDRGPKHIDIQIRFSSSNSAIKESSKVKRLSEEERGQGARRIREINVRVPVKKMDTKRKAVTEIEGAKDSKYNAGKSSHDNQERGRKYDHQSQFPAWIVILLLILVTIFLFNL